MDDADLRSAIIAFEKFTSMLGAEKADKLLASLIYALISVLEWIYQHDTLLIDDDEHFVLFFIRVLKLGVLTRVAYSSVMDEEQTMQSIDERKPI